MPYRSNTKYTVNVPQRSGFDKSHRNSGTGQCGTLIPILCDEVIPNSRVSLKLNLATQMPPLVSDTYMNVKLKAEAFFVPSRLLCQSFEDFFCDFPKRVFTTGAGSAGQSSGAFADATAAVPVIEVSTSAGNQPTSIFGPGTLLDYLGVRIASLDSTSGNKFVINSLPIIAYHLIWQEYYRNPRVQNPAFAPSLSVWQPSDYASVRCSSYPYLYFHRALTGASGIGYPDNSIWLVNSSNYNSDWKCADGTGFFALRQRNFGLDYFSGARVSAQQGAAQSVSFDTDVTGSADLTTGDVTATGNASFTIAALRAANSLQQFRERNNLPSPRLVDQVKTRYGANLSDGVAQRPICIGSCSYDMTSVGVSQTGADGAGDTNPFSSVGAQYGRAYGAGSDFIISDFVANEPGYVIVLISQVPEATYSFGVDPMFNRYLSEGSITDMACAILQNVGDQEILAKELHSIPNSLGGATVFGYTDRYADFMFKPNVVHGQFRSGQSLDTFVAQRGLLNGSLTLSSSFLEIPTDFLDDYTVARSKTQLLTYWYDCMLDYKVSMPLAEYSIPSLQDPAYEHGQRVTMRRNGQIF